MFPNGVRNVYGDVYILLLFEIFMRETASLVE